MVAWYWTQDADKPEWITVNGTHIPVKNGELQGKVGKKIAEESPFGKAYLHLSGKPAEAIEHLMREKNGYVPAAFHKEELGDIDLPYGKTGKKGFGLAHIIERRNQQGLNGEAFARNLPQFIAEGKVERRSGYPDRAYIVAKEGHGESVIRLDWDGKERAWLATAFLYEKGRRALDGPQTCSQAHDDRKLIPLPYSAASMKKIYTNSDGNATSTLGAKTMNHDKKEKTGSSLQTLEVNYPPLLLHRPSLCLDGANIIPTPSGVNMKGNTINFDASPSVRSTDENGYLHVAASHITKATVNPYYGREIPGGEAHGLDPDKIYQGLRHPDELKKSLQSWAGLPLHIEHHIDSAEDPQHDTRVGAVGTEIVWNAPYVDAPLIVWDQTAIDSINDGSFRELSCAYRYDPDFTPGTFEGQPYDFVMRNIRGNHVALVEEGRAGPDVLVADAKPQRLGTLQQLEIAMKNAFKWFRGAKDSSPAAGPETKEMSKDNDGLATLAALIDGVKDKLAPEELEAIAAALEAAAAEPVGDEEPEKAKCSADNAEAMKKAGLDADDPDEAKAFAEGVKFGAENGDGEEDIEKGMDACGLDTDNPAEAKAFAEGCKYGAEQAKDEDTEAKPEAKPEAKKDDDKKDAAQDADDPVAQVLAACPDLSEEQQKKLAEALTAMLGAADEDPKAEEAKKEEAAAQDRAMRKRVRMAADTARVQAKAEAINHLRGLHDACAAVRPLVGELNPLAFDSASNVYGLALEQSGVNPHKYHRSAWKGMVDMLIRERNVSSAPFMAADAKALPADGPLSGLNRIKISE